MTRGLLDGVKSGKYWCRVWGQGVAGCRKGKNPLGPPTVTDETMGIKIKERKNGVLDLVTYEGA